MALRILIASLFLSGSLACIKSDVFNNPGVAIPDGGVPPGLGVGAMCSRDEQCRPGLGCGDTHTCQPKGNAKPGDSCLISPECTAGNWCALDPMKGGVCAPKGKGNVGDTCTVEGDCMGSLICNLTGLYGTCAMPGKGDINASCDQTSDCLAGLLCANHKCNSILTLRPWEGARCPEATEATAKPYFHVPRPGEDSQDFYKLPYPNDIRKKNGKISLDGYPRPGAVFLPFDPLDRYFQAMQEDMSGFGLNAGVFFRFSKEPKLDSLQGALSFHDLTGQAGPLGHSWSATTGGGKFICPRYVFVHHGLGQPLKPGNTYAVIMTNAVTDGSGAAMDADDDFKAVMADSAPADPTMAAAWQAYAPLRKYLADKKMDASKVIAAAVFTTENVDLPIAGLRAAARAAAPTLQKLVKCGAGPSPCEDGKTGDAHTRGCLPLGDAPFDEYQGVLHQPVFQTGKRPYEQPSDGGGIVFDASGMPMAPAQSEDVCVSITVPRGAPPAGGWPTVVYAHGTGGNYRSHIETGLATDFAKGDVGGAAVPMAMIGYDGVLHGPRRGGVDKDPEQLVYNFVNPRAARDNALQAAADLFALAAALEALPADMVPLAGKKLGLYGHSQGANAAAVASGFEPAFGATVLSGSGGTLMLSFLYKVKPVNVPAALPVLLGDANVGTDHPVLNLLQSFFERADPVNFARRIAYEPPMGVPSRHIFHVYGLDDLQSPVETQRTLAQSAALQLVGPQADDKFPLPMTMAPAKGNMVVMGGARVTSVEAQYKPGNYDGHFVSTENASARRALRQMLGTFFRDGVPTVAP